MHVLMPGWRDARHLGHGLFASLGPEDSGHSHQQIILLFDDTIYIPIWGKTVQLSDRIGRRMKLAGGEGEGRGPAAHGSHEDAKEKKP